MSKTSFNFFLRDEKKVKFKREAKGGVFRPKKIGNMFRGFGGGGDSDAFLEEGIHFDNQKWRQFDMKKEVSEIKEQLKAKKKTLLRSYFPQRRSKSVQKTRKKFFGKNENSQILKKSTLYRLPIATNHTQHKGANKLFVNSMD